MNLNGTGSFRQHLCSISQHLQKLPVLQPHTFHSCTLENAPSDESQDMCVRLNSSVWSEDISHHWLNCMSLREKVTEPRKSCTIAIQMNNTFVLFELKKQNWPFLNLGQITCISWKSQIGMKTKGWMFGYLIKNSLLVLIGLKWISQQTEHIDEMHYQPSMHFPNCCLTFGWSWT